MISCKVWRDQFGQPRKCVTLRPWADVKVPAYRARSLGDSDVFARFANQWGEHQVVEWDPFAHNVLTRRELERTVRWVSENQLAFPRAPVDLIDRLTRSAGHLVNQIERTR